MAYWLITECAWITTTKTWRIAACQHAIGIGLLVCHAQRARRSFWGIPATDRAHLPQAREPSMSDASLVADSDDEHAVSMVMDGPAGNAPVSLGSMQHIRPVHDIQLFPSLDLCKICRLIASHRWDTSVASHQQTMQIDHQRICMLSQPLMAVTSRRLAHAECVWQHSPLGTPKLLHQRPATLTRVPTRPFKRCDGERARG